MVKFVTVFNFSLRIFQSLARAKMHENSVTMIPALKRESILLVVSSVSSSRLFSSSFFSSSRRRLYAWWKNWLVFCWNRERHRSFRLRFVFVSLSFFSSSRRLLVVFSSSSRRRRIVETSHRRDVSLSSDDRMANVSSTEWPTSPFRTPNVLVNGIHRRRLIVVLSSRRLIVETSHVSSSSDDRMANVSSTEWPTRPFQTPNVLVNGIHRRRHIVVLSSRRLIVFRLDVSTSHHWAMTGWPMCQVPNDQQKPFPDTFRTPNVLDSRCIYI
jgi:hypothetical protein